MIRQPVLFEQVVTDCLTALQPLAKEKKITCTAELAPAIVEGDPDALAQLVSNLLGNAIHHNHAGGTVHVRLGTSPGEALLLVTNTGPGIPRTTAPASSNASTAWTRHAPAPPAAPAWGWRSAKRSWTHTAARSTSCRAPAMERPSA